MSSYKLRKIDTSNSTPSRSHTSSPIQPGGGDHHHHYCESPDTLFPLSQAPQGQVPRSRRRDTSPTATTTVIGMSSQSPQQQQQSQSQQARRNTTTTREIPFIGGGFSSSSSNSSSSSRPLLTKRGSSNNQSSTIGGFLSGGGGGRRRKCSKLIGLLCGILLVYWVAKTYILHSDQTPRKKLTERWWELPEEQLDPGRNKDYQLFYRNLLSYLDHHRQNPLRLSSLLHKV